MSKDFENRFNEHFAEMKQYFSREIDTEAGKIFKLFRKGLRAKRSAAEHSDDSIKSEECGCDETKCEVKEEIKVEIKEEIKEESPSGVDQDAVDPSKSNRRRKTAASDEPLKKKPKASGRSNTNK